MSELNDQNSITDLLQIQELAWKNGERIEIEQLLARLKEKSSNTDAILELVYNEVALREKWGEHPCLEDYLVRFPAAAHELTVQFAIDQWIVEAASQKQFSDPVSGASLHRLGRYQIQEEMGRGTMGVVYRAWDPRLKRIVAIKRLLGGKDASEIELKRLRTESEAIGRIRNKYVVQIYDIIEHDGLPYLAMEYCSGGSLASRLREQPLPPRAAAEMMMHICEGIAAAHASQVLHRDLKPANILLENEDSLIPKISDFGLAKQLDSTEHATLTGSIVGSPAYMSPEQAFGDTKCVSAATDIYAMGAILYECLTGRPPFRGATIADTLDMARRIDPVPIRTLQPSVPIDLETIAHKCLRKEPNRRYESATELGADLQRFLNRAPIRARRETWVQSIVRTYRRYPVTSTLTTAVAALLIAVAVGSLIFARQLNIATQQAIQSEKASAKSSREARLGLAEALVGRAHGIRLSRRAGQRFEALRAIRQAAEIGRDLGQPAEWFDPLRNEAISALMLPDSYVPDYRLEDKQVKFADFSQDHRLYACKFVGGDHIALRRMNDHSEIASLPELENEVTRPVFVGKDYLFLCGYRDQIQKAKKDKSAPCEIWDVSQTPPVRVWHRESGSNSYRIASDAQRIAIADEKSLTILDVATGNELAQLPITHFSRAAYMAIHPKLPLVFLCSYFCPNVQLLNYETGKILFDADPCRGTEDYEGHYAADWTPDGSKLFLVNAHASADHWYELDAENQVLREIKTGRPSKIVDAGIIPIFNATGDRFQAINWGNTMYFCDVDTGSILFRDIKRWTSVQALPFSVDSFGKYSGCAINPSNPKEFGFARLAEGRECTLLDRGAPWQPQFEPYGRFVTSMNADEIVFTDLQSGRKILRYSLQGLSLHSIAFDASGHLFTSGTVVLRWPYRISENGNRLEFELGLPERMHIQAGNLSASHDGKTILSAVHNVSPNKHFIGYWAQLHNEPAARRILGHENGSVGDVSPDGHFIAALHSAGARVWKTRNGISVAKEIKDANVVRFTANSKALLAGSSIFDVNSWNALFEMQLDSVCDLATDGTQALSLISAGGLDSGVLRLIDTKSGKALADIAGIESFGVPRFSPDRRFIATTNEHGKVLIDLERIRAGLNEIGLDWDAPKATPIPSSHPIQVGRVSHQLKDIQSMDELLATIDEQMLVRSANDSADAFTQFSGAMIAIERRDLDAATELIDRSCSQIPDSITPRQWRAYLRAAKKDFAGALADAEWVLGRIQDEDFRFLRAQWGYEVQNYELAISDCTRIIQASEGLARYAYGLRSLCYSSMNDMSSAASDRQRFLESTRFDTGSLNVVAHRMLGDDIAFFQPRIADLIVKKMRSLQTQFSSEASLTIALTDYCNERYSESIDWIHQHLEVESDGTHDGLMRYVLAMAQHRLGNVAAARLELSRAQNWQPKKPLEYLPSKMLKYLRAEASRMCSE